MLKEAPSQPTDEVGCSRASLSCSARINSRRTRRVWPRQHRLSTPRRGRPLLPRLDDSATRLDASYAYLSTVGRDEARAAPSEEWLRDNFHVVQDQIRAIRQDLPRSYYLELPKLADGPFEGYPRVYVLARELIVHTAGRFDLQTLVGFAAAYQRVAALDRRNLGDPDHAAARAGRGAAAARRRDVVEARAKPRVCAAMAGASPIADDCDRTGIIRRASRGRPDQSGRLPAAFVVELLQWLRDQPRRPHRPGRRCIERSRPRETRRRRCCGASTSARRPTRSAIGNIISSMRLLSSIDWPLFFERVSLVEQRAARRSGGRVRGDGLLRRAIAIAIRSRSWPSGPRRSESDVARRAVALAEEAIACRARRSDRRHHVGYYLISRGRFALEREVGYRPTHPGAV